MTISGDGDAEYQPIEFLLPFFPGKVWHSAPIWKKKGKSLVDMLEAASSDHLPKVIESARMLLADGWRFRLSVCGLACRPPSRVEGAIGDHFVGEPCPWGEYFKKLGLPVHPQCCGGAPRGLAEISDACSEACDWVWYGRSVNNMIHTRDTNPMNPACPVPPPSVVSGMLASQMRMEAKYGAEELMEAADDPFEAGMVAGKLSAIRWLLGESWDSLYT